MVKVNSTVNGNILTFLDAPRATITMESRNFSMEPASDLLPDKYISVQDWINIQGIPHYNNSIANYPQYNYT